MLINHLKSAFRSLLKQKSFALINTLGLAIGLAGCLLILQYIWFESSYDKFHEKSKDIYRVSYSKTKNGIESFHTVLTYAGVGPALKEQFPEVLDYARLRPVGGTNANALFRKDDQILEETRVFFADPSFLDIFSFDLIEGNPETVLQEQFHVVLSESTAQKYFGNSSALGKELLGMGNRPFIVSGVVKDVPLNAHIKFDILISHNTQEVLRNGFDERNMTGFHGNLYILTQPGTTIESLEAKFPDFINENIWTVQNKADDTEMYLHPMPLEDIHLNAKIQHESEVNGDAKTVTYLFIIAIMLLIIAWVNYINLATARAAERAKEVGVRKVLGSLKRDLIRQFMVESAVTNFAAIVLAIVFVLISQRVFIVLGETEMLSMSIWKNTNFWLVSLLLWAVGVLLSGFYPAFVLSSFKPISVLRGSFYGNKKGQVLRKALVIFQFASSVALLIGTAVVFLQINHMQNLNLGVNIDQSIVIQAPVLADSTYTSRIRSFKTELERNSNIQAVVASADVPGRIINSATWFREVNKTQDDAAFCFISSTDQDFIETMEIDILAGRNFLTEDNNQAILINKEAADQLGFASPEEAVNREITFSGSDGSNRMSIKGVVNNFYQLSPKENFNPLIIRYRPFVRRYYVVKYNTGNNPQSATDNVIKDLEQQFAEIFPGNPFSYFFLDDSFEAQYESDKQFGEIFGIFSLLAVIVACLGLFGLAAHTVVQKTKEIGIRKVLGSSIVNILSKLSWEYIKLIIIANAVIWPVIYYLMNQWLDTFVERVELSWWLFPLACLVVVFIAMLTVSFHTIRAARANPVKALRYE